MYGPVETAINLTATIIDVIFVTDNIVKNSLPIVEIDHLSHHFNFHYNHLSALHVPLQWHNATTTIVIKTSPWSNGALHQLSLPLHMRIVIIVIFICHHSDHHNYHL